jgi:hypothetical protein
LWTSQKKKNGQLSHLDEHALNDLECTLLEKNRIFIKEIKELKEVSIGAFPYSVVSTGQCGERLLIFWVLNLSTM